MSSDPTAREVVEIVRASRARQGLAERIEDQATLEAIAAEVVGRAGHRDTHARIQGVEKRSPKAAVR